VESNQNIEILRPDFIGTQNDIWMGLYLDTFCSPVLIYSQFGHRAIQI
jgi:hypothetical protein